MVEGGEDDDGRMFAKYEIAVAIVKASGGELVLNIPTALNYVSSAAAELSLDEYPGLSVRRTHAGAEVGAILSRIGKFSEANNTRGRHMREKGISFSSLTGVLDILSEEEPK